MQTNPTSNGAWLPEDAANSYRSRHKRDPYADGLFGATLAACSYAFESFGAWLRQSESRAAKRLAPLEADRFPTWVSVALPFAREAALQCGPEFSNQPLYLLREPFLFEQLMAQPPLPAFYVKMAAYVACERSAMFDWRGFGRLYRDALGETLGQCADEEHDNSLGLIASHFGRLVAEIVHRKREEREPGRPVDVVTSSFIMGVAEVYAGEGMGEPMPLDLAEIAMVWRMIQGTHDDVLRQWNNRAEQHRKRLKAGQIPISR